MRLLRHCAVTLSCFGRYDRSCLLTYYTVSQKNKTPNSCPYLRQMLIDFQNSFTVTRSRKFATKRSIQISPPVKDVATLPCEILVSKNCTNCYYQLRFLFSWPTFPELFQVRPGPQRNNHWALQQQVSTGWIINARAFVT